MHNTNTTSNYVFISHTKYLHLWITKRWLGGAKLTFNVEKQAWVVVPLNHYKTLAEQIDDPFKEKIDVRDHSNCRSLGSLIENGEYN